MNMLSIRVDSSRANHPQVRLLVDGVDVLAVSGNGQGNDPEDILDTGALLPVDPPRRIAFYGCDCGVFGCGAVAGLVAGQGSQVTWTDFRDFTGVYGAALPDAVDLPDPLKSIDWDDVGMEARRIDIPDLAFDADQYLSVVHEAMADRSWESPARVVARLMRERKPSLQVWAAHDRIDAIEISGGAGHHTLALPETQPDEAVESFFALLRDGIPIARIAAANLWR